MKTPEHVPRRAPYNSGCCSKCTKDIINVLLGKKVSLFPRYAPTSRLGRLLLLNGYVALVYILYKLHAAYYGEELLCWFAPARKNPLYLLTHTLARALFVRQGERDDIASGDATAHLCNRPFIMPRLSIWVGCVLSDDRVWFTTTTLSSLCFILHSYSSSKKEKSIQILIPYYWSKSSLLAYNKNFKQIFIIQIFKL